jgi:1,4-dihydroxy-2-naphthoate octaprenyltransferase
MGTRGRGDTGKGWENAVWSSASMGFSFQVALSIFNVILINEFPDYRADREAGKLTLVARFGVAKMSRLYALISAGVWGSYIFSVKMGIPVKALLFFSKVSFIVDMFYRHIKIEDEYSQYKFNNELDDSIFESEQT